MLRIIRLISTPRGTSSMILSVDILARAPLQMERKIIPLPSL